MKYFYLVVSIIILLFSLLLIPLSLENSFMEFVTGVFYLLFIVPLSLVVSVTGIVMLIKGRSYDRFKSSVLVVMISIYLINVFALWWQSSFVDPSYELLAAYLLSAVISGFAAGLTLAKWRRL